VLSFLATSPALLSPFVNSCRVWLTLIRS
jgi:hypothetical protein